MQSKIPLSRGTFHTISESHGPINAGDHIVFGVDATLERKTSAHVPKELWEKGYRPNRGKRVVVPASQREDVARNRLSRHGLMIDSLEAGDTLPFSLHQRGRDARLVVFPITVSAIVTDSDAFERLRHNGFGNLKNYGAGLIRIINHNGQDVS